MPKRPFGSKPGISVSFQTKTSGAYARRRDADPLDPVRPDPREKKAPSNKAGPAKAAPPKADPSGNAADPAAPGPGKEP